MAASNALFFLFDAILAELRIFKAVEAQLEGENFKLRCFIVDSEAPKLLLWTKLLIF